MTLSLFGKRRDDISTTDKQYVSRWRVATYAESNNEKRNKRRSAFSFWSATKYVMILSLLLWWLPVFGQMIAGYVGGRKAGSPWRGVAAAILPVIAIFSVITLIDYLLPSYADGTGSASASLLIGIVSAVPFVGPYLDFTREYVSQFLSSLQGASPYEMNSYLLTIAFAYVGGILADQARREIDAVSGTAGNHTTVMIAPGQEGQLYQSGHPVIYPTAYSHATWGFLPHFSFRKRPEVCSFEQLVPEDVETEDDERSVAKRKTIKRRLKHEAIVPKHHMHAKIEKAHLSDRSKPVLRVSTRNPRALMKIEKRIEREWDPKYRKKRSPWAAKRDSAIRPAGTPKTRMKNWESF